MLAAAPSLANVVGPHPYWGGRPQALHLAVEAKRRDMAELLLDHGADPSGDNAAYDDWSPMMLAIHHERPELASLLSERGARIGLVEALMAGDDARGGAMLDAGAAALPARVPNNGSLLAFARTTTAIDRLIALGASTTTKDKWGRTPVATMSRLGARGAALVRHMAKLGVTVAPEDYARSGDAPALVALIEAAPAIAKADAVMMGAVEFRHHALVEQLLTRGASANARDADRSRQSVLHIAAWNGDLKMAELLVAAGADITARDAEHNATPREWAETSVTVSKNADCEVVAVFLGRCESS